MIPTTFPSDDTTGTTRMVAYLLSSVTGLKEWIDYIPVMIEAAEEGTETSRTDSYNLTGFIACNFLADITNKQAWLDYVPCFIIASPLIPYSTDVGGYIPVNGD